MLKRVVLAAVLCLMAVPMWASTIGCTIAPNLTGAPVALSGDTLVASTGSNFTLTGSGGATLTGCYYATVYRTGSGTLDFTYQVQAISATNDQVGEFTADGFPASFFLAAGNFGSGIAPTSTNTGTLPTVQWFFGGSGITPGSNSDVLYIQTNAHSFVPGTVNIIDGGVVQEPSFDPARVPEPASLVLLGTGLLGIGGTMRRRFGK